MKDVQFWSATIIGFIATFIAVIAFLPQSLKTVRTKKTNGISLITFIIYTLANALWVFWGIIHLSYHGTSESSVVLKDAIVITANIPCTMWAAIILGIKIYNMYQYGEDCKKWQGKANMALVKENPKTNLS